MKTKQFILSVLMLGFACLNSASAGTATATINFTADRQPGCTFSNNTFNLGFGTVETGTVGKAQLNIPMACSVGTTYTLGTTTDSIDYSDGTHETLKLTAYTNAARTNPLDTGNSISGTASAVATTHTLYFRLNGPNTRTNTAEGYVVGDQQSFTMNFPLLVTF